MSDVRLIERWLPIEALGEESVRERRSMTALPPTYYLHVWWARRPLVASRAAVLASLLPADADRETFMHVLGIHGDPVKTRQDIDRASRTGEHLGSNPYGYRRAFQYLPSARERDWLTSEASRCGILNPVVLDPTAGGGSIPLEAVRLGLRAHASDLNPVAALIERATVEWPARFGLEILERFEKLTDAFLVLAQPKFVGVFPPEEPGIQVLGYLWARTVRCPYCDGLIPLAPNWRLAPNGVGVRLLPRTTRSESPSTRRCDFEIVRSTKDQSAPTVSDGDATCPFPDCGRIVDGDIVKQQAQTGQMGEQLFAVAYRRPVLGKTKSGRAQQKWERGYRTPRSNDDNSVAIADFLRANLAEWEGLDVVPNEDFANLSNYDRGHRMYGMRGWRDMFSPRQLLGHASAVEVMRGLVADAENAGGISDIDRAAFAYLALSIDRLVDYNSRQSTWDWTTERIRHTFVRHNFAHTWSYAEMAPIGAGLGYRWAFDLTAKCIEELVELARPSVGGKSTKQERSSASLFDDAAVVAPAFTTTARSADDLTHIADETIDAVVMDPPYYDNVMYAELSDFFYVWLKRTAGHVFPELFTRTLTDKENEAVANAAKFQGEPGAKKLAARDYQERMAAIFAECRRVLKPNGIMTLMFTHKATGAWDALTTGLMQAGFTISASWPINTEAEGSLHIKDKAAANSTIFLACRPRLSVQHSEEVQYWEDIEPRVARAVRSRVAEFEKGGIHGVDLYLASFGPALEEFSKHWPLKRGTPAAQPEQLRRRKQKQLFEETWDPYAVTPEDALNAARREVKRHRLEQLTHAKTKVELDPLTSFFVLAWDAFKALSFPYDEALRLARAVGADLDREVIGRIAEKKGSNVRLWDSSTRAAKHALGPVDGSRGWIDTIHHAAHMARLRTLDAAREMLEKAGVANEPQFFASLEAVLEVLPVSRAFSGVDLDGDLAASGTDFEVLEKLRRLAFSSQVDEPGQLDMWKS
jgi:adenine-specific DNA methylase